MTFEPDYAIPPGATLFETMGARCMGRAELAFKCNVSEAIITAILDGDGAITDDLAEKFEAALGVPASFWRNLEANYRRALSDMKEIT